MDEPSILSKLMQKASAISGESIPLGLDLKQIQPTLAKLPAGPITGLESLLQTEWPSEGFHVGRIELFGPERINLEHEELFPCCAAVAYGFLGIAGAGGGLIVCYCVEDRKVYLLPPEYITEDAVYVGDMQEERPLNSANIKLVAEDKWDSMTNLLEWAYSELLVIEKEGS